MTVARSVYFVVESDDGMFLDVETRRGFYLSGDEAMAFVLSLVNDARSQCGTGEDLVESLDDLIDVPSPTYRPNEAYAKVWAQVSDEYSGQAWRVYELTQV